LASGSQASSLARANSSWYTNFDTQNLFIQLGLTASDSSTGGWRLIYENKTFRRDFESSKRSREKGVL
jgi:hypothetical protein